MPRPRRAGGVRRRTALLLAAAAAAPLLGAAPASASVYCGSFGPIERAFGPVCTVKCAYENPPQVDPSGVPPVRFVEAPCMYED